MWRRGVLVTSPRRTAGWPLVPPPSPLPRKLSSAERDLSTHALPTRVDKHRRHYARTDLFVSQWVGADDFLPLVAQAAAVERERNRLLKDGRPGHRGDVSPAVTF